MKFCFVDRISAHSIWGVIAPVAEKLLENGHQVFYVRMNDGGDRGEFFIPEGVKVSDIVVPKKGGVRLLAQQYKFASAFSKLLVEIKPDIVHTNFAVPSIAARWVAHRVGVPVIVSTQHELCGSMRFHYRLGLRLTERFCKAVTYVSETVAKSFGRSEQVRERGGSASGPQHLVIANGVNVSRIQNTVKDIKGRVPGRIVCAGRLVPVKGHEVLVRAFAAARQQYPHLHLHLIGTGPLENELRALVKQLALADSVHFLGWRSHEEVLREMAEADLVVAPSDGSQEGFGLVVAEALAVGSPILASDIPVFREVLGGLDEQCEFFSVGNVDSLADKICGHILTQNSDQTIRLKISRNINRLSSAVMADKYLDLYRELCESTNLK